MNNKKKSNKNKNQLAYAKRSKYAYMKKWQRSEHGKFWHKLYNFKKYAEGKRFIIYYLMNHPCIDCGNRDIRCLCFDHVNGKSSNVWDLAMRNPSVILSEIEKCEIRCANCHRIRHYENNLQHPLTISIPASYPI